jgi:hypothetical protein
MRNLAFYGASDDLFEIEGSGKGEPDEVGCFNSTATAQILTLDGDGLHVVAKYAPSEVACWMIGLMQLDEGKPLPDWPMRWKAEGYSVRLEIDAPDDAKITMIEE